MGEPDVDALARRLAWPQVIEWLAYLDGEHAAQTRADLRAAVIARAVLAGVGVRTKVEDFFPYLKRFGKKRRQSVADMMLAAKLWAGVSPEDDGKYR